MQKLLREYRHFRSSPHDMRILLLTNLIYAHVGPVLDLFVAAYVMRNSRDVRLVVTYQLAVYAGIPCAFLLNGVLLRHVAITRLYALGMLLSGASLAVMMALGTLRVTGIGVAGLLMSLSFGLFWANRDFLVLSSTTDANRTYYYGLETFFYTTTSVVVPAAVGWFIEATAARGWFGGERNHAYQIVTGVVVVLTVLASLLVHRGRFANPPRAPFVFWRYHGLWGRMQRLAVLKGLAQGYIVTAPAMLILRHVGQEGALGTIQAAGGIVSACLLYRLGRTTGPEDRVALFAVALVLFALGGLCNALLFNAAGVLLFLLCLLLARPLHDLAYFPIQMRVIEAVSALEHRNPFAYLLHQEFGFFAGRLTGCVLFLVLATQVGDVFALRYALLIVGLVQLLAIPVARSLVRGRIDLAPGHRLPFRAAEDAERAGYRAGRDCHLR